MTYLGSNGEQTSVLMTSDGSREGVIKRWPSATGLEFVVGLIDRGGACEAGEDLKG
jgi:hypothetical protein